MYNLDRQETYIELTLKEDFMAFNDSDFSFEIVETLGTISTSKAGWTTDLKLISWGGRPPKYDIRSWSPDSKKMGKGVTLSTEELIKLKELLSSIEIPAE